MAKKINVRVILRERESSYVNPKWIYETCLWDMCYGLLSEVLPIVYAIDIKKTKWKRTCEKSYQMSLEGIAIKWEKTTQLGTGVQYEVSKLDSTC